MTDTKGFLRGLMARYTTDNVDDLVAFRKRIDEFLAMDDYEMEGYESPEHQRDKSVKFEWGHNHDFGDFQLEGVLGDRHIDLLATFIDDFGLPKDLTGKRVLDVGVWCGGTSLLLYGMGANVTAIDEVYKYVLALRCLEDNFCEPSFYFWDEQTPQFEVIYTSLYEELLPRYYDSQFDYIIFPGVLYHLTDPILALRILFNALKDGGTLFIESAGTENISPATLDYRGGKGWSWFVPSLQTLYDMLGNVGFENIKVQQNDWRLEGSAQRIKHKDMLRAGLSNRYVK